MTRRMRILVIAPQVPWPPRQGTAIRNFNLILELAKRHSVTVAAFDEGAGSTDPIGDRAADPLRAAGVTLLTAPAPPPRSFWARLFELPTTITPDLARRLGSTTLTARLHGLATAAARDPAGAGFDIVQIEGLEMAPHGLAIHRQLAAASPDTPRLIYDAHNAEWVLQDRAWRADILRASRWPGALYSIAQTAKLRRYERSLLKSADAIVAVSDADAAALRPLAPEAEITVVPNGVDVDHYLPPSPGREEDGLCVFTGKMDFRPNVDAMTWFCREAWPLVRAARSGARLEIVGRAPAPAVQALHDPDSGIVVTGDVPDVRPFIERAAVVVVPLRVGGGTRLKILEAMAMGKAIAATTLAVEGLDVRDGQEARLADSPAALATAIVSLLGDPATRLTLGAAARAKAESSYRWSALVPRIEQLYG